MEPEEKQRAGELAEQTVHDANRGLQRGAEQARDKWHAAKRKYGPKAKQDWERAKEAASQAWAGVEAKREADKASKVENAPKLPDQWWTKANENIECSKDGERCKMVRWFAHACHRHPFKIREGLRLTPVYDPEHPEQGNTGVEIREFSGDSVFAALGFEDGDEIQSVNGLHVADPVVQMQLYAEVRDQDAFEIVYVRHGKRHEKTISVVASL